MIWDRQMSLDDSDGGVVFDPTYLESRVVEPLRKKGPSHELFTSLLDLSRSLMRRGNPQKALQIAEEAVSVTEQFRSGEPTSYYLLKSDALEMTSGCLYSLGRLEEASDATLEIVELFESGNRQHLNSPVVALRYTNALRSMGDILCDIRQVGVQNKALGYYQRSLEVSERLLADNPQSAQALRDVVVSLERMANCAAKALEPAWALAFQERALEIARRLYSANQGNWGVGRTLAISLVRTSQLAAKANPSTTQDERLAECYAILHRFHILIRHRRTWNKIQPPLIPPRMHLDMVGEIGHERRRRIRSGNLHTRQNLAIQEPVDRRRTFWRMQMPKHRRNAIAGDGACYR